MTKNEKKLIKAFEDVIWMAVRYAHGRSTYAPHMVRDAVNSVKEIYPDFKLKNDITIKERDKEDRLSVMHVEGDYLNDLFEDEEREN